MEDRHTIISAFTPLSFASAPLPDGVERSFAAIYDGHNGSKAAEYACSQVRSQPQATVALPPPGQVAKTAGYSRLQGTCIRHPDA